MYRRLAAFFAMSDRVWARHENPWSVWTRVAVLPALTALLLLRADLGWGFAPLLALLLGFVWVNPRLFPAPRDRMSWPARAVRGERFWLERRGRAEMRAAERWALSPALGAPLWLWGVAAPSPWAAWAGAALVIALKLKFLDETAKLAPEEGPRC